MPLPFAIPAALSGALRHWKLAGLALLILALGVQTLRLGNAQDKAERFKAERNAARAELVAISTAKDEQKAETGRNIVKARQSESDAKRVSDRIRNAPVSGKCETPKEIMGAEI
jgi:type II secretory pathway pseudopilin PulG